MDFTLTFVKVFMIGIAYVSPILISLTMLISFIGLWIGRKENWNRADALYFAFVTATTVGYGDFHPKLSKSKYLAILIAFAGVLLTGIVVAVGLSAVETAFREIHGDPVN